MDEIDKSVFKIPGLEPAETSDFDAQQGTVCEQAEAVTAVKATDEPVLTSEPIVVAEPIAPIEQKKIVPKEIIVKKQDDQNFYDELTAISEEILECRSKILEIC